MVSNAVYFLLGMGTFSLIVSVSLYLAKLSGGETIIEVARLNSITLVFFVVAIVIAVIDKVTE